MRICVQKISGAVRIVFAVGFVYVCACLNPFFPPTGDPLNSSVGRSNPAGVIQQLYQAYETRQLNLYADLFSPKKDFKFYVAPVFEQDYIQTHSNAYVENIDSSFEYAYYHVLDKQAYYWTYDEELYHHSKMFAEVTSIYFTQNPQAVDTSTIRYFKGPDSIDYAEVIVRGGQMALVVPTPADGVADEYLLDIGTQVFYLEHDPANKNLWVIAKWFDLGTANSVN